MPKRIQVAMGIIYQNEKILITQRRASDSLGGLWEFPGGKVEVGESPEACLHRELKEELDVSVRITDRLEPIHHTYDTCIIELIPFLCDQVKGDPKPLCAQRLMWVTPPQLQDFPFPVANTNLLRRLGGASSEEPF